MRLLNTNYSIRFTMDSEIWIYIALIAIAIVYFLWNQSRIKSNKKDRKNKNFRARYQERKEKK